MRLNNNHLLLTFNIYRIYRTCSAGGGKKYRLTEGETLAGQSQLGNYQVEFANEDSLPLPLIYIAPMRLNSSRKPRAEIHARIRTFVENDDRHVLASDDIGYDWKRVIIAT